MSTEEIINQAMESTVTETPITVEEPTINEPQEASEEISSNETESEDVVFPKKAVNALSRRDKTIAKLKAEQAADRAELQRFRESMNKPQESSEPSEADYETYGEYLEAKVLHKIETKQNEGVKKQEQEQSTAKYQEWIQERQAVLAEKAQDAVSKIPDYRAVYAEYQDVFEDMPEHINQAFLELDDAPLAFYALAKEGKLESLQSMSPAKAIIELGKAEDRGIAMTKVRQTTKAPAPLSANKGNGMVGKSLNNMSADELLKWAKS